MKRIKMVLGILSLLIVEQATAAKKDCAYQPYPEDLRECARRPLISGAVLENGQAALTLAFNERAKIRHAYLIFETKQDDVISVRALHFGGRDSCLDYYQGRISVCAANQTEVRIDDTPIVLTRCHRAIGQEYEETPHGRQRKGNPFHADAFYAKHTTFIVSAAEAAAPWRRVGEWREGRQKITFSFWGDVFFSTSHNCSSFVSLCFREAGLPITIPGLWARSPENLKYYAAQYARAHQDTSILHPITIRLP